MIRKWLRGGPALAVLFLLTFVVELYMLTFWMGKPSLGSSPFIWAVTGMLNAWTGSVLIARYGTGLDDYTARFTNLLSWRSLVALLALAGGIWYAGSLLAHVYHEIPEFSTASDILPGKREYVRRFLHGETVYVPVQFDSYALQPTFLPFRWLPFVIAELMHFDYRWIPFAGFVAGMGFWIFSNVVIGKQSSYWEIVLKAFLPFLALGAFVVHEKIDFALTVELLILGYHLILARFIFSKNPWVVGFSLVLCLLSRYSIVLWLAVPVWWLLLEKRYAFLGKVMLLSIAGIFLFYWLPFCRHDMGRHFLAASEYYVEACKVCWKVDSWLPPGSLPNFMGKGQGFQYLSYAYGNGGLEEKYQLNINLGLIVSAIVVLASCRSIYRHLNREDDPVAIQGLLLGSFKIYMLFFIGFILCPFSYLFIVPFFMSLPLLYSISFKSAFLNQRRDI